VTIATTARTRASGGRSQRQRQGESGFIYWSWAPAPDAPDWEFPYIHSLFSIVWYNGTHLTERLRIDRIGTSFP